MVRYFLLLLWISMYCSAFLHAQSDQNINNGFIERSKLSVQWFLANRYYESIDLNRFELKRGYFTIKTNLNKDFSIRYTQDITVDREGEDIGNVEIRLKYLYLKMNVNDFAVFTNSYFEFGLVHRPWLDFEQDVNPYRVQGRMAVERYRLLNSADFGITYVSLLGGELDDTYQEEVSDSYPGRYGSFSIGLHNGGGYHALEKNNNKTVETRLSIRPFNEALPGFQVTYSGVYGKANVATYNPDFIMNLFFLSFESKQLALTAQYFSGKGSFGEHYLNEFNEAEPYQGYSGFGEMKVPGTNFAFFGRYDHFSLNNIDNSLEQIIIGGITYRFLKNKVLIDYNRRILHDKVIPIYELALEIKM